MESFEPQWINSKTNMIDVISLRLGSLQVIYIKTLAILIIYSKLTYLKSWFIMHVIWKFYCFDISILLVYALHISWQLKVESIQYILIIVFLVNILPQDSKQKTFWTKNINTNIYFYIWEKLRDVLRKVIDWSGK